MAIEKKMLLLWSSALLIALPALIISLPWNDGVPLLVLVPLAVILINLGYWLYRDREQQTVR